jgi:hypothetical protein
MNECKFCGVELDSFMNYCPLCGKKSEDSSVNRAEASKGIIDDELDAYDLNELTEPQKSKLFWELSGIILVSGIFVSVLIDLITNKTISWSRYILSIGLVLFFNISLLTFLKNRVFLMLFLSFVSVSILLWILDFLHLNIGWGINLGVPIILIIYALLFILYRLIETSRQKGINIIAYVMISAGILLVCIESILSLQRTGNIHLYWSLIALVSLLSVSIILLFIHFRLKKVTDLKRFFHI